MSTLKTKQSVVVNQDQLFRLNPDLAQFKKTLVTHKVFDACESAILSKIARPGAFNILSVVGPTGAGKTLLLNEVAGTLIRLKQSAYENGLDCAPYLPVVFVTAATGRTYESRFRNLLIDILEQVNRVVTDLGKASIEEKPGSPVPYVPSTKSIIGLPIARLEQLVRSGLKERKVLALLVDEAQHLAQGSNTDEWRLVVDGLKLLGSVSGTLVVLFGTSELLGLPYISGQLGRRSKAIHFRRYLWADPEDRREFKRIVAAFSAKWPTLLPKTLLFDQLPLLYTASLGCPGTLSDLFHAALSAADQAGEPAITLDMLFESALSEPKLRKIDTEARACENSFAEEQRGLSRFVKEMCGDGPAQNREPEAKDTKEPASEDLKQRKPKPFNRKPTYDSYNPKQIDI